MDVDGKVISKIAIDVIRKSRVMDDRIALPPQRLDRELYMEVLSIVKAFGARWDKLSATFRFPSAVDLHMCLNAVFQTGRLPSVENLYSHTLPTDVVKQMINCIPKSDNKVDVLIPFTGTWCLIEETMNILPMSVITVMTEEDEIIERVSKDYGSTFRVTPFRDRFFRPRSSTKYDIVIVNPLYVDKFDGMAYINYVMCAVNLVRIGGHVVTIVPKDMFNAIGTPDGRVKELNKLIESKMGKTGKVDFVKIVTDDPDVKKSIIMSIRLK